MLTIDDDDPYKEYDGKVTNTGISLVLSSIYYYTQDDLKLIDEASQAAELMRLEVLSPGFVRGRVFLPWRCLESAMI